MPSRPWLPGLFSGALLGLTTIARDPRWPWQWAIFFGFVPLWSYWLREKDPRRIALAGWICQITFGLIAFHWIAYTVNEFSHLGLPLSILVMLGYCALGNLQFPLAGWLWAHLFQGERRVSSAGIAGLVFLTALGERLGTTIFHWNFGYAWLYLHLPGAQVADIAGFRWLCSLSICLNGFLLAAWARRRWQPFAIGGAIFLAVNALGAWRLHVLPAPDASVRVLLLQPDVTNREKERQGSDAQLRIDLLERNFRLTDRALAVSSPPSDFVIWPENAFPSIIADENLKFGLSPRLRDYVRARHLNLLTGGYGVNAEQKITNGFFAITAEGKWHGSAYEKQILLPFGEYVPGAETFPILKRWFPDVSDYGRGHGTELLHLADLSIGAQICYEGLFDSVARALADAGAQVIVNVTNDSWYGKWAEPWQHFYITMAKAVETRRPLIRDTNSGISSVILASGEILAMSPVGTDWFHAYDVPYRRHPEATPFQRWGYRLDWIFLVTGALLAIALSFRGPRRRATPSMAG